MSNEMISALVGGLFGLLGGLLSYWIDRSGFKRQNKYNEILRKNNFRFEKYFELRGILRSKSSIITHHSYAFEDSGSLLKILSDFKSEILKYSLFVKSLNYNKLENTLNMTIAQIDSGIKITKFPLEQRGITWNKKNAALLLDKEYNSEATKINFSACQKLLGTMSGVTEDIEEYLIVNGFIIGEKTNK